MLLSVFLSLGLFSPAQVDPAEARRRVGAAYNNLSRVYESPRYPGPGQRRDDRAERVLQDLGRVQSEDPEVLSLVEELKGIASLLQEASDQYRPAIEKEIQRLSDRAYGRLQKIRDRVSQISPGNVPRIASNEDPEAQGRRGQHIRFSPYPDPYGDSGHQPLQGIAENTTLKPGLDDKDNGPRTVDVDRHGRYIDWTPWTEAMHGRLRPVQSLALQLGVRAEVHYEVHRPYVGASSYQIRSVHFKAPAPPPSARQQLLTALIGLQPPPYPEGSEVKVVRKVVYLGRGFEEMVDRAPTEFLYY